ncbi:MAG: sulfurtransferase TusA family protein [Candidatus Scalinduaceae bacterium]
MDNRQVLEIIATDDGIKTNSKPRCEKTGNELLKIDEVDGKYHTCVHKLALGG